MLTFLFIDYMRPFEYISTLIVDYTSSMSKDHSEASIENNGSVKDMA